MAIHSMASFNLRGSSGLFSSHAGSAWSFRRKRLKTAERIEWGDYQEAHTSQIRLRSREPAVQEQQVTLLVMEKDFSGELKAVGSHTVTLPVGSTFSNGITLDWPPLPEVGDEGTQSVLRYLLPL